MHGGQIEDCFAFHGGGQTEAPFCLPRGRVRSGLAWSHCAASKHISGSNPGVWDVGCWGWAFGVHNPDMSIPVTTEGLRCFFFFQGFSETPNPKP